MKTVALSFLGTNNYSETGYEIQGKVYRSKFIQHAIRQHFNVDTHFILTTDAAREKHGASLLADGYSAAELIPIQNGASEEELWQIFATIEKHVPSDVKLIFDVTHGFRIQPMLALAALVFLRFHKNVEVSGIYYGLFEQHKDVNKVLDITPFLDLIDWSFAIRRFQEKGDAGDLAAIMASYHKRTYVENQDYKAEKLISAGSLFKSLMQELSVIRPQQAMQSAEKLFLLSDELKIELEKIPQTMPLALILESAKEEISGFIVPDATEASLFEPAGISALYNMCRHYLKVDKYQQCLTLATELFIGVALVLYDENPLEQDKRQAASKRLQSIYKQQHIGPKEIWEDEAAQVMGFAADIRNDINHAGIRNDPKPAKALIQNSEKLLDRIYEFLTDHQILLIE